MTALIIGVIYVLAILSSGLIALIVMHQTIGLLIGLALILLASFAVLGVVW